jgi:hypothetical protein
MLMKIKTSLKAGGTRRTGIIGSTATEARRSEARSSRRYPKRGALDMTELLQRALVEIEKLPVDTQDAVASRILADLAD